MLNDVCQVGSVVQADPGAGPINAAFHTPTRLCRRYHSRMINPGSPTASAETIIGADADAVYALVADIGTLATLASETETMEWVSGDSARPGSVFRGHNRNGSRQWSTTCTITDAHPGKTFGFDVKYLIVPIAHWQYDITALESGGCQVTESMWDMRPSWFKRLAKFATGVSDRKSTNTANMKATLERLKQRAESSH